MRPHTHDLSHNLAVGQAFRRLVGDLVHEAGRSGQYADVQRFVDSGVGEHVNAVAGAAYDLGQNEEQQRWLTPSQN